MSAAPISSDNLGGIRSGRLIGGKYLLIEPLGAGGMGQVWAARNLSTDAEVAIKLLHTTATTTPDAVARLRREAYATCQLSHRSVLRMFDLVEDPEDGALALVMERLRGRTLAEALHADGPLPFRAMLDVVLPILNALHHAHEFGIIHRDLKPENIFLAREADGEIVPKLVDFGISKILRDGNPPITGGNQIVGTPSHMSPEQLRGTSIDARSDVFCAGIVIYMCLTGQNPFASTDSMASLVAVLETDPPRPPGVPPSLWKVIKRSLAKNPADRFASAIELRDRLLACEQEGERDPGVPSGSATTRTLTETRILPEGWRRRRFALGVAAGVSALAIAALCEPTRAADRASRPQAEVTKAARPPLRLRAPVDLLAEESSVTLTPARPPRRAPSLVRDPGF